ncbi:dimethylargininase [Actinoplanes sp. NPDC049548]|uniref:dimethylargininase n=1 Tax=Actinoplanes sp. NPDC049548 TaxID=3155152 RepID=UPI0034431FC9
MPSILVRRPSPRLAEGELTHLDRRPVDADLALRQWQGYVAAFSDRGWQVVEVQPADEYPDGVFVEDTVVVFGDLAVLTSPGALSRRGEITSTATAVQALGLRVARISEPGHLDGGDVLEVGDTVYVGRSTRTDEEGVRQLQELIEPLGRRLVRVPVNRALHLKSAVTALPDGTIVGYEPLLDDPGIFDRFLPVPEELGSAVVVLDDKTVLMSAEAPRTSEVFAAHGLDVAAVPISEFEKLEGCVTCLSVRVRAT